MTKNMDGDEKLVALFIVCALVFALGLTVALTLRTHIQSPRHHEQRITCIAKADSTADARLCKKF